MKFRALTKKEIEIIKHELKRFVDEEYLKTFPFENLYALVGNWINVVYATKEVIENLKNFDDVYGFGVMFGEFSRKHKNRFLLSLEGMSLISDGICKNYAIVNEKGETMFLYGRDVFKSSILEIHGKGKVAVFNKHRDFLGIGKYDGKMIKNIKDKGWYLREGG
jgi:60S ribosome subunit biogenesis protein NIP7